MQSTNNQTEEDLLNHADKVAALQKTVLSSPGETEPAVRQSAFNGEQLLAPLEAYVTKIRGADSYKIMDSDVMRLKAAGYSEDAIFEITVAAALGAAIERLERGLTVLRES